MMRREKEGSDPSSAHTYCILIPARRKREIHEGQERKKERSPPIRSEAERRAGGGGRSSSSCYGGGRRCASRVASTGTRREVGNGGREREGSFTRRWGKEKRAETVQAVAGVGGWLVVALAIWLAVWREHLLFDSDPARSLPALRLGKHAFHAPPPDASHDDGYSSVLPCVETIKPSTDPTHFQSCSKFYDIPVLIRQSKRFYKS
jgi:hypothetical protein